jgi:hypothetical protein
MIRFTPALAVVTSLGFSFAAFAEPDWAKENTVSRTGADLVVACSGRGPAVDLARKEALRACGASAASYLQTEVEFKTLTVQTETDAALHQEAREEVSVTGLECRTVRDKVEVIAGSTVVWLQCKYSLDDLSVSKNTTLSNAQSDARPIKSRGSSASSVRSTQRSIVISSIPGCDSILVVGKAGRIVRCKTNPVRISVGEDDVEITIRSKNHVPKTVRLDQGHETIRAVLDPM